MEKTGTRSTRCESAGSSFLILLSLCAFSCFSSEAQQAPTFNYRQGIADKYISKDVAAAKSQMAVSTFDLTTVLPKGYVQDGSVDYTSYLQNGLDKHKDVTFPAFPVLVNDKGLSVGSNSNIYFKPGSRLQLQASDKENYEILRVHNVQNVNIYSPVIEGDRKEHKGSTGQWGMGLSIRASKNVNVYAPRISGCWGDGIYIGALNDVTSSNVNIYNAYLDFNRRNGMSIVSVDGLKLIKPVVANTFGQSPMSGIDIEPNNNRDVINNIVMDGPVTLNNAKHGIVISLSKLIGVNPQDVNISIRNHQDDGSSVAFSMGGMKQHYDVPPMKGNIEVINPVWKNNVERPFRSYKPNGYAPTLKFTGVNVLKTDNNGRDKPDAEKFMLMQKTISAESKMILQQ
ncbi:MAG TPA: right-handed parallel beta-helix repeat-containing protein [Chitinophaga sp.]|uniref:right-handed parallel beta-helix repeat-containing protein n=1 Tax=Chitinophaga sp. TaxID=1869181 RepID=UPI002C167777|nr:right-handed parallel beta-helix repeat-containing protein [Chitinophaga sp.]HVI48427.1 right-handed parallel beta-helix repeat-containing protein [Chitinophaga sp.]